MTNRNTTQTLSAVWALNANTDISNPQQGTSYRNSNITINTIESGQPFANKVDFGVINQLLYTTTLLTKQLDDQGILSWCEKGYELGSIVMGSNGSLYRCYVTHVTPKEPLSNSAFWKKMSFSEYDEEYVNITGHNSLNVVQTAKGTYTYPISGFTGPSINSTEIRHIYIDFVGGIGWDASAPYYVSAIFPDGVERILAGLTARAGGSDEAHTQARNISIPVNKNQNSIILKIERGSGSHSSFNIIGAKQRVLT